MPIRSLLYANLHNYIILVLQIFFAFTLICHELRIASDRILLSIVVNAEDVSPSPSPSPSSSPENDENRSKTLSAGVIAGITIASFILVCGIAGIIILRARRMPYMNKRGRGSPSTMRKEPLTLGTRGVPNVNIIGDEDRIVNEVALSKELVFMRRGPGSEFKLMELLGASAVLLGKGSFGMSYKATLESGRIVVIKRLKGLTRLKGLIDIVGTNDDDDCEEESFIRRKIEALGGLEHPHLAPFFAYFVSKNNQPLLVMDYMPNGSLSTLLHGDSSMEWEKRLRVALAMAEALVYLHEHNIVHGNLKSSNVLMDKQWEPHLADYGLAPIALFYPNTKSDMMTYLAPELLSMGFHPEAANPSTDVYSFGVLLLELIIGKSSKATTITPPSNEVKAKISSGHTLLPQWVESIDEERWVAEVFDSKALRSEENFHHIKLEMTQLLKIALSCVVHCDARPTMIEVVSRINDI